MAPAWLESKHGTWCSCRLNFTPRISAIYTPTTEADPWIKWYHFIYSDEVQHRINQWICSCTHCTHWGMAFDPVWAHCPWQNLIYMYAWLRMHNFSRKLTSKTNTAQFFSSRPAMSAHPLLPVCHNGRLAAYLSGRSTSAQKRPFSAIPRNSVTRTCPSSTPSPRQIPPWISSIHSRMSF